MLKAGSGMFSCRARDMSLAHLSIVGLQVSYYLMEGKDCGGVWL